MTIAPFSGWPRDALAFYGELEEDNTRAFWQANKARYDDAVRRPLEELLEEACDEFGEAKVFRPNRDTRFSKDKSPYKTQAAAYIARRPGGGWTAGFYVQLSAEGLMCGAGLYDLSPDQLRRFRAAVDHGRHGPALERVVADLRQQGMEIWGRELQTAPRGFDQEHPRIELLRHRRIVAARSWPPRKWLHEREALDRVRDTWRTARPLVTWLDANVGPPEPGAGRG